MVRQKRRVRRIILWTLLGVATLALVLSAIVAVPMLTHQSAGSSGQQIPQGFVSETTATGADGRTRTLTALTPDGEPADLESVKTGEVIVVQGSGFDASIGMYVAVCAIPSSPEQPPSPCLGGIPDVTGDEAANEEPRVSEWITDDWAWRAFATGRWDDPQVGAFTARLVMPDPAEEGIDCREQACAIATRADHTAGSDRIQDMLLPIKFE